MACDVSWKSRLSTLNDENVLLKTQVDVVVQEKGNIKLEYQNLFNSIKATRDQHQQEVNELIESINQKTYAYGDVHSENQDLLMKFFELKDKLKTFETGKGVNTKFDKSVTLEKLLCVTPLPNNTTVKAKKMSNTKVKTRVKRSNSVRRPKSKDNKSKNRVSKSINDKSSSAHLEKVSSSVSIDSNKRETMNSTVCQSNTNVLNNKIVNAVNDDSRVKRALFTTPKAAKYRNLGATFVVAKSRFSVAKTPTATTKVSSALSLSPDFSQSNPARPLNFRFGNDHFAAITGYGDYVQGNFMICHVYYIEGLGHNLFLIVQFYDGGLEAAFRSNTYYVQNLEGDDLLTGSCKSNIYTISISELATSSPVCLMSKATSTKSWLWHRRLSHLNFGTINQLTSKDLVDGLPKFKYNKDHLCSAYEQEIFLSIKIGSKYRIPT
ncbi:integrase, catalytic region, zinc finger, CCHC-type containing protein [Tanacetum coccineum]